MIYEHRQYLIFKTEELNIVDFTQVLETSQETVRKSVDQTKKLIKLEDTPPSFINKFTYTEGPMTRANCILWRNLDSYTGNQLTIIRAENVAPNINNLGVTIARISTTYNVPVNIRVSGFSVYDRVLTAQEITQNFNATKSRYGL